MPESRRKRFWRRCRRVVRWCRITLLVGLLLLVGAFLYFNLVGVPEVLKRPLLAELRQRGLDFEFSRLRFRWFQGLVAESVTFAGSELAEGPELAASEIAVQLDYRALARLRLEVESVTLLGGRFIVPLTATDQATRAFTIDDIRAVVRFLPGDRWELDRFQAVALGGEFNLVASLTNAAALTTWRSQPATNRAAWPWRHHLRQIIRTASDMEFARRPQIILHLRGDAAQPSSITADLNFNAGAARTRWGSLDHLLLVARLNRPTGTNDLGQSELRIQVEGADTPWGHLASTQLEVDWRQALTNPVPVQVDWTWRFGEVRFPWGRIPEARFRGHTERVEGADDRLLTEFTLESGFLTTDWMECRTNRFVLQMLHGTDSWVPRSAAWDWQASQPSSRWGGVREFSLRGGFDHHPPDAPSAALEAPRHWWAPFRPFQIRWSARLSEAAVTNLVVDVLRLEGHWAWPHLAVDDLQLTLGGQELRGVAEANVVSGGLHASARSDLEPGRLAPLLPEKVRNALDVLQVPQPPEIEAQLFVPLPPWTEGLPDWRGALPGVTGEGELRCGPITWKGVEAQGVRARLRRLQDRWEVERLALDRPEGTLEVSDGRVRDDGQFEGRVRSRINPLALRPLVQGRSDEVFKLLEFRSPPDLRAELSGRWDQLAALTASGSLEATNFSFRGEPITRLSASLLYSNRFVTARGVDLALTAGEFARADSLGFDVPRTTLHLTNATARVLPSRGAPLISPHVARLMAPYRFDSPPEIRAQGWAEVRYGRVADMRFHLAGGPFHYWRFNLPWVESDVHWVDETVTLTNLSSPFYGGRLEGDLRVDSTGKRDPDIRFNARVRACQLRPLISDLVSPTNKLEGTLSGEWNVTFANTADWKSWDGYGRAELLDGYLWDIPLFGMFTPMLNAVIPGMGNSRFSAGTADFTMTNSVFHTKSLELRSPLMRLDYDGTIDFDGNVNARVEARILRDAWVVGPLVSFVFTPLTKLFEFRVTGTLNQVQKEPLYIPKPLLLPLQPFKVLRDLFVPPKKQPADAAPVEPPKT